MPANVEWMVSGMRQRPWHGIGEIIEGLLTAEEALEKSRLNYAVELWPVAAVNPITDVPLEFDADHRATVRINADGSTQVLAMVGSQYTCVQNRRLFDFCAALTQADGAIYETAGILDEGRRVFIMARLEACDLVIADTDKVEAWLTLASSHDASLAFTVFPTDIRTVCLNTLMAGMRNASRIFTVRHTPNPEERIEEARRVLGLAYDYSREFETLANSLAATAFAMPDMQELANSLYQPDPETKVLSASATIARRELPMVFALEGARSPATANTAWAAWNAVGERVDHRPSKRSAEKRLNSIWFGADADIKRSALDTICTMRGLLPMPAEQTPSA